MPRQLIRVVNTHVTYECAITVRRDKTHTTQVRLTPSCYKEVRKDRRYRANAVTNLANTAETSARVATPDGSNRFPCLPLIIPAL